MAVINRHPSKEEQYLDLLSEIIHQGVEKESGRPNMPDTLGLSHGRMQFDLQKGFPLLTTKKMFTKGIFHELLWFLRGDTHIKYLVDNGVNIWNQDAYKFYLKNDLGASIPIMEYEEFVAFIKREEAPHLWIGDLGKVYGYQWRRQNGVDQLADVIKGLKENPFSRYHIINAYHKADFPEMALPPCHVYYQFTYRPLKDGTRMLDMTMMQRSCDTFLGVPFNIASAAALLSIVSATVGMLPGVFTWVGNDVHLYENHIDQALEQYTREPKGWPKLNITGKLDTVEDIENLTIDNFEITEYESHPAIKAELSVGLKK